MMDSAALITEFDRNGYVIVPGQLDPDVLDRARRELGERLASSDWGTGFDGTRTKRIWALLATSRCMDAAALDPLVLQLVEHAIGPGAQFSLTQATQIHPGQKAQFLHYEQGIYPLPRDHDVMVTAMWALDDFTAANGGTLVVPGSHVHDDGKPDAASAVAVQMTAGSVLVFSGRMWHAGGTNTSQQPRLGVIIDYVQPWLRPCEAHTLSVGHDQVLDLPERLQELMGFNQPQPYFGFIGGRHPRDWLAEQSAYRG